MSISLPYYREPDQLPGPLPSQNEIETATRTLSSIRNPKYDRIVVIRDIYVVKYGVHVNENEGHALFLLGRYPSIPVPQLYAMYRDGKKLYIVMEFVSGTEELETLWPSLSESEKYLIMGQLRSIFQEVRSIPSPGFYGGVARGPLQHRYFLVKDRDPSITGPFESEREFGLALSLHSRKNWEHNRRHGWISDFLDRNLPSSLNGHQSTFTHSDLHPQNILIRQTTDPLSEEKRYTIAAVIDWESAGWYPTYWEYAVSFALFRWIDDWPEKFEKAIDPWPLEAAMIRFIHQDLEF